MTLKELRNYIIEMRDEDYSNLTGFSVNAIRRVDLNSIIDELDRIGEDNENK